MPTKAALVSPGRATSERSALEITLAGQALRALTVFLVDVEKAAAASLVGGDPLTLGAVQERWEDFVEWMTMTAEQWQANPALSAGAWAPRNKREFLPGSDLTRAKYLTDMRERLRKSDLPQGAYDAARQVLVRGRADNWSQRRTTAALTKALHRDMTVGGLAMWEDDLLHGTNKVLTYDQMIRRIARTEATTLYNYAALTRLADGGARSKRWVSHHDNKVRDSHLAADGQIQYLSDPFIVGGFSLMVPGDPNAPTHETANCRCVLIDARIDNIQIASEIEETGPLGWVEETEVVEVPAGFGEFEQVLRPTGDMVRAPKPIPPLRANAELAAVNGYLPDAPHYELARALRGGTPSNPRRRIYQPIEKPQWNDPPDRWHVPEESEFDRMMREMFGGPAPPAPPVYGTGLTGKIRALDSYIQRTVTTERSIVFRGFVEYDLPITPGAVFKDRMYTSVSIDPEVGFRFAQMRSGVNPASVNLVEPSRPSIPGRPVLARIILPPGTPIGLGDPSIKELILMRGNTYRVLAEEIGEDGVKAVTMELLPRTDL